MQRYLHLTLLYLAIFVVVNGGLFLSNTYHTLTWAEEKVDPSHEVDNAVVLSDKAKVNIGLKTAEADLRTIEKVVQVTGNVIAHPGKQGIVTPRISGIVKRLHYKLGDTVKKGDVLLELESIDLQLAEIDLMEAVHQQKSLDTKLAKQKSVFAKQIQQELQTRQIDFLESHAKLQEEKNDYQKIMSIAIVKTISALEKMRVDLVKADVERRLLADTLARIEALTEKRISAQKELISQRAAHTKATNAFTGTKRQFQLLGVSEKTLQTILEDEGKTPILTLLNMDTKTESKPHLTENADVLKYISIIEEATTLTDAESAYKTTAIKVKANRQRALAAGMTAKQLEQISASGLIIPFSDLSVDKLIENYAPFMTSSEALEALLQTEEAQRNAAIMFTKARQKLEVYGMTADEIDKLVENGKSDSPFYVTAPTAGQIISQNVMLGATVEKSNALYSILDSNVVWVEGEIYEDTLALIHDKWEAGNEVRVRVPAYPDSVFIGKISQISSVVDSEKRTVHFWTEVDNPDHKLKPGMFAEQTLVIEKLDDVLSVPLEAVLKDGASQIVFVESGNTYMKHEVVIGAKDDRYIEIKDGLFAGEIVVVQGTHQLLSASAGTTTVVDPHAGHSH